MLLPSSSSSVDKDHYHHHHHIGSSGSSTAMLSGQSALMEIEKLLLKFDGNFIVIWLHENTLKLHSYDVAVVVVVVDDDAI